MGVRGVTPLCLGRPDPTLTIRSGRHALRDHLHPPSRQGQRLRWREARTIDKGRLGHGCLLGPPELGAVDPDAVQDDGKLARERDASLCAPMRFASRAPQAFRGDQRRTFVRSTLAAS